MVIGVPSLPAMTEVAVQLPGGPYSTTPVYWALVAQLTWTEVWVRSVRYGARVSAALAPESDADAGPAVTTPRVSSTAVSPGTATLRPAPKLRMAPPSRPRAGHIPRLLRHGVMNSGSACTSSNATSNVLPVDVSPSCR